MSAAFGRFGLVMTLSWGIRDCLTRRGLQALRNSGLPE
jgi:hypothetical protein